MKKLIFVFTGLALAGSLTAATNVEYLPKVVSVVIQKENKTIESIADVCTICYNFPNGNVCSTGETCAEAETAVRITLGLDEECDD